MVERWQYQESAEPLEPSLTTPQALAWLPQAEIPVLPLQPSVAVGFTEVRPLEPSLVIEQALSWLPQAEIPVLPVAPNVAVGFIEVRPLEPSLVIEQALSWLLQAEIPVLPLQPNVAVGFIEVRPLEPSLVIEQALSWLPQAEIPVLPLPQTALGIEVVPISESNFGAIDLDWYRETSIPVFDVEPLPILAGSFWTLLDESTGDITVRIVVNRTSILLETTSDMSGFDAWVIIEYTRNP